MSYIKNFIVFNSLRKHGGMPDNLNRIAQEIGFDENYFFSVKNDTRNKLVIPGTTYKLTKNDIIRNRRLLDCDVFSSGVKMGLETSTAVIGSFVSDSPSIIAINKKTFETSATLCNFIDIIRGVPFTIASNLGGKIDDILIDVSPFAYKLEFNSTEFYNLLNISNNFFVRDFVDITDNKVIFRQKDAIVSQLVASGINSDYIYVRDNSLYNVDYYSDKVYHSTEDGQLCGKFVHGVMYELDGEDIKAERSYIKKYSVK